MHEKYCLYNISFVLFFYFTKFSCQWKNPWAWTPSALLFTSTFSATMDTIDGAWKTTDGKPPRGVVDNRRRSTVDGRVVVGDFHKERSALLLLIVELEVAHCRMYYIPVYCIQYIFIFIFHHLIVVCLPRHFQHPGDLADPGSQYRLLSPTTLGLTGMYLQCYTLGIFFY